MTYHKAVIDGYIVSVGTSKVGNGNSTEHEYNEILSALRNAPIAPTGYGYRLREDLTWELYELPVVEISDEITNEEAYKFN